MSDRDSFMDEVAEEVRRDRLYGLMRRYGWIAVLVVVLIVGGAAWREYSRAQAEAAAQAFGDAILASLANEEASDRVAALAAITPPSAGAEALLSMMIAAEASDSDGDAQLAADRLQAVSTSTDVPEIYRQIAAFKLLTAPDSGLDADARRAGFEGLAAPGNPLRLLAEEQLAWLDLAAGDHAAARTRLDAIVVDAETTADLRLRATRLIVALREGDDTAG